MQTTVTDQRIRTLYEAHQHPRPLRSIPTPHLLMSWRYRSDRSRGYPSRRPDTCTTSTPSTAASLRSQRSETTWHLCVADDEGSIGPVPLRYRSDDGRSWTPIAEHYAQINDYATHDGRVPGIAPPDVWISEDGGTSWHSSVTTPPIAAWRVTAGPWAGLSRRTTGS